MTPALSPFSAVVFDMDGTLLDTELVFKQVVFEVTEGLGFAMTDEVHGRMVGSSHEASNRMLVEAIGRSRYLYLTPPMGALYAFVGVQAEKLADFDDQRFALDLLEHKHVLVAPGSSFNVPYRNHFRITNLPEPQVLADVFGRMEELLDDYATGDQPATRPNPALRVVETKAGR